jgi:hypothetical protein
MLPVFIKKTVILSKHKNVDYWILGYHILLQNVLPHIMDLGYIVGPQND